MPTHWINNYLGIKYWFKLKLFWNLNCLFNFQQYIHYNVQYNHQEHGNNITVILIIFIFNAIDNWDACHDHSRWVFSTALPHFAKIIKWRDLKLQNVFNPFIVFWNVSLYLGLKSQRKISNPSVDHNNHREHQNNHPPKKKNHNLNRARINIPLWQKERLWSERDRMVVVSHVSDRLLLSFIINTAVFWRILTFDFMATLIQFVTAV